MTVLAIDTLKLARRLREHAGFTPEHAEAAAEAFADAVAGTALVTKEHLDAKLFELKTELRADLVEVEHHLDAKIAAVETKLESKITAVETKLESRIAVVEVKLAETKVDLLKWIFGAMAAQSALLLSAIKYFGH